MHDRPRDDPLRSLLFTDLYELTMARAYAAEGTDQEAVFELFFRKLPPGRNYIVAAGLGDVLDSLETLGVTEDDLDYLRTLGLFSEAFLGQLRGFRFTGEVWAVPEGTVVFPDEPLVQVVAPILEAQLVEALVLNQVHFPSLVASKAARVVTAAAGRDVVEFGSRRAHGTDAALKAARAAYLMGAVGTSNVLAGQRYGIPVLGTMAHSYIQTHDDEAAAFAAFAALYPGTTLLVDTYDTLEGVRKVIDLGRRLGDRFRVRAIRLDSGDLGALAGQARQMLDAAGLHGVRIFASGGLDEHEVAALIAVGAPIDAFGVGTKLAVSEDVPSLDMAYKLVAYAGRPRMKLSSRKAIYPGRKQVIRRVEDGRIVRDVIGRHDETLEGEPLLQPVMRRGARLAAGRVSLEEARVHARRELERLPEALRSLAPAEVPYRVEISSALQADHDALRRTLEASQSG
ncbi:MAG: nicotinate phosphoribosyltransferase [Planctomycetaceae bacterium]|nr:nicotinate phosphoribosyltransferase [Planctomycetaceae bacterium]